MTSRSSTPVRLRGVSKRYGSTTAVDGLDLEVGEAEVLGDERLRSDAIHANAAGYEAFAERLLATARAAGLYAR